MRLYLVQHGLAKDESQGNRIKTVTFPLAVFPNNHYPIQL